MNPLMLIRLAPWGLAAVLAVALSVQTVRVADLKTDAAKVAQSHAEAIGKNEKAARAKEQAHAAAMAEIGRQHLEDQTRAKAAIDRLTADVAAGTQRLRQRFTCPAVKPSASPSPGAPDAGAGLLPADVGILVGLARECDGHVRSLQAVIKADRR